MAYSTRELQVKITGDTSDLDKSLSKAGDSTNKAGEAIRKFAEFAKPALLTVGAATAALGVAAAKASWDQVDAVQQATVALGAYERDGSKVNAVLANLIKYARSDMGVLFNRKDLFAAAQNLKIMGDNTSELTNHVKIMSRSVGLGLSTWEGLGNVIGRVGSTGKLYADDLQYLQNAGFKLDSSLSGTSQTFETLFEQLNKGIPTNALDGQAGTIRGIGVRLETAFRGIGDAILGVDSNTSQFIEGGLGDRFTRGMVGAIGLLKDIKQPISETTELLLALTDNISSWAGKVYEAISAGFQRLFTTLKPVIDWINTNIMPSLRQIGNIIGNEFKQAWEALQKAMNDVNQVFKDAGINIDYFQIIAGLLLVALIGLVTPIIVITAAVVALVVAVAEAIRFLSWLTSTIINFAKDAAEGMVGFVEKIIATIGRIGTAARNIGSDIWNAIRGAWERVMTLDWGAVLVGIGRGIGNSIINLINGAIQAAFSGIPILKDHIPQLAHFAIGGIVPGMPSQGDNVLVAASAGEMILNRSQQENLLNMLNGTRLSSQSQPNSNITLEVNIGMYAGMPVEKREIALQIWRELVRAARAQGVSLPMIGAVGVQ